jgi:hypothetical protein
VTTFQVDVPAALLEAKELEHRVELAKARMLLICYRQALEENGIEPPDPSGDDLLQMWRDASAVISSASDFVARLGTAKELLSETTWR